ncbi:hypothetical protein EDD22DRAFT_1003701 [Suillus occidentalis]|nr:hypothetical protein EDD22DRAFT_1003701 [Suillus occidentalis]
MAKEEDGAPGQVQVQVWLCDGHTRTVTQRIISRVEPLLKINQDRNFEQFPFPGYASPRSSRSLRPPTEQEVSVSNSTKRKRKRADAGADDVEEKENAPWQDIDKLKRQQETKEPIIIEEDEEEEEETQDVKPAKPVKLETDNDEHNPAMNLMLYLLTETISVFKPRTSAPATPPSTGIHLFDRSQLGGLWLGLKA